jgi:aryl-alcohol dehydrogenase-like predicted oxidoreductase
METRPLGDTGHDSSIVTLGAFALQYLTQEGADRLVELALRRGVNHVDVAPTYGDAELKLGPKLREHRDSLFVGCKTRERGDEAAWAELERSRNRLGVETIDLYQFHAVTRPEEVDAVTADDGALAAVREAQASGVVEHVGLTSHGHPDVILDAMDRIDLDTVMFPLNPVLRASDAERHAYGRVLERARDEGVGTIGIKAFARGPWPEEEPRSHARPYGTWYEPVDTQSEMDDRLDFALSEGLTTVTNPGDPTLAAIVFDAGERHDTLDDAERAALLEAARGGESPVPDPDV